MWPFLDEVEWPLVESVTGGRWCTQALDTMPKHGRAQPLRWDHRPLGAWWLLHRCCCIAVSQVLFSEKMKMMKEAETHNFSLPFQTPPWRSEFYLLPLSETLRERETKACRRRKRRKRAAPVMQTHCTKKLERGQSQFSSTGQKHLKRRLTTGKKLAAEYEFRKTKI